MAKRQSGLTMTPTMWLYVDDLRRTGLYGDALSAVLRTLVSRGIEDAIGKKIIAVRNTEGAAS